MIYRLFASDFDDTLVPIGRDLSAPNRAAIRRVRDAGIRFAIASGRCSYGLLVNARRHGIDIPGLYLIGFNGAEVSQAWDGRLLFSQRIELAVARRAARFAAGFPVAVMVPEGSRVFSNRPDNFAVVFETTANQTTPVLMTDMSKIDFEPGKLLFGGERAPLEELAAGLRAEFGGLAEVLFSADFLLEFNARGVTKGGALTGLCAALGIDVAESVAMGDNHNDIALVEAAGLGIAVGNAVPELQAVADRVTVPCTEDAVAHVLNELFPPD